MRHWNYLEPEKLDNYYNEFKMKTEIEIELIKKLQLAFSIAKPVIKNFDGKVMNQRLITAINKAFEGNAELLYYKNEYRTGYFSVYLDDWGKDGLCFTSRRLYISPSVELKFNIADMIFTLEIPKTNERINYETINFERTEKWMQEYVDNRVKAIEDFKQCYMEAVELENKIYDWQEKYGYTLQNAKNLIKINITRN